MCYSPGYSKPTHGYGLSFPESTEAVAEAISQDGFMSCPCGRGDYHLCTACPYESCSVHGGGWAGKGFEKPYEES